MSSGMFWVSSLFVALMLILMPTMIVCAKIKKFILFNADDNSTRQVPLDSNSSAPITLFYPFGNKTPIALDYDYVAGRVYWSYNTQGGIFSSFFNATSQKILFHCNVKKPEGLAIDYVGRNIYWTDAGTNRIEVGLLDGTGRKLLIKDGLDKPKAIVLHIKKSMMYWTEWGATSKIKRAGMDGSARQTIVTENLGWPNGLTIDLATDRLYWVDAKLNNIERSDLNGGNRQLVVPSAAYIHPNRLAVFENTLYWTDWNANSISSLNSSRRNQQIIVNDLQKPMDFRVFDSALIFSGSHPCTQNNGRCSDLCLLKPGRNGAYQCACPTGVQLKADGKSCDFGSFYEAISDQFMIFAEDKGEIYKVPLGLPETPCYPLGINTNISSPAAVDYDPVEGKIYWTDPSLKLLARAYPNGSSVEVIAHSNVVIPGGLAVDHVGRHIYWTDESKNRIEVAKLDGSSRKSLIATHDPRAILLDIGERKMYWGAGNRGSVKIEQANLDGSGRKALVSDGVMQVNSLAMDYKNRLLYWCDALLHTIERFDLQRNNHRVILNLSSDCMQPFGLALFGDVLYWSDWKSNSVHKYNMTTSVQGVIVSGVGKPMKLHIYDISKDVVAATCAPLRDPANAHLLNGTCGNTYGSNCVLIFGCQSGYVQADGNATMTCLETGNWSGIPICCKAACAPLEIPVRAHLLNGTCVSTYGSNCVFRCNSGHVQADGNAIRTCLENGRWSGIPIYCIENPRVPTSSLAIVLGLSSVIAALLALLCVQKRHLLIRTWRRLIGNIYVEENNPAYEEMDDNQDDVQQVNDGFQNQHNQGGRGRRYIRQENVGVNNQENVNKGPDSAAGAEELELHVIRRSSPEHDQINAVASDTDPAAGSSNSDERGSDDGPVRDEHILCIHELVGVKWKKVLRKLSMPEIIIKNLEEDFKHSEVAEKCHQGLLKWKETFGPQGATIKTLCQALRNVGCAEAGEALLSMSRQSNC